ncbi:hypothetical protein LS482_17070 [Sinomicrobium kalidii]|uniref:hypothetical protein n=1 Tax=Sinomicrobium kalidii TaxID=2900738 RepID=UPI001E50EB70|nr:hypothetical protein [Sinomicrobium kalidii]UGU15381.1 hypothetical protein LS482_17070 [Sinomicrobium kalidii]
MNFFTLLKIKKGRRIFFKKVTQGSFVLVLLALFTFSSCQEEEGIGETPDYSGEDLFRGVYFLQGEAAHRIKSYEDAILKINELDNEAQATLNDFYDDLIQEIKKIDPGYFDTFKEQMTSNNVYAIEHQLEEGREMLTKAGLQSEKYKKVFEYTRKVSSDMKLQNIDFRSEKGIKEIKGYAESYFKRESTDVQAACVPAAAVCVVVALAVWEAAVTVNVTAVGTVAGAIYATLVYKASIYWAEVASAPAITREAFVTELENTF